MDIRDIVPNRIVILFKLLSHRLHVQTASHNPCNLNRKDLLVGVRYETPRLARLAVPCRTSASNLHFTSSSTSPLRRPDPRALPDLIVSVFSDHRNLCFANQPKPIFFLTVAAQQRLWRLLERKFSDETYSANRRFKFFRHSLVRIT